MPLVTVTGPVAVTVGVPEIWTSPEETLTIGMLNPGADDHGFVAWVDVTVGVPLIWTNPDEALTTVKVPVERTASPPVVPGISAVEPSVPPANFTYW